MPTEDDGLEMEIDAGWCLIEAEPFPEVDAAPVVLSYCEIRVDAKAVQWFFAPRHGIAEEYTDALTADDLAAIEADLAANTPQSTR
jgi:hypothetical protein